MHIKRIILLGMLALTMIYCSGTGEQKKVVANDFESQSEELYTNFAKRTANGELMQNISNKIEEWERSGEQEKQDRGFNERIKFESFIQRELETLRKIEMEYCSKGKDEWYYDENTLYIMRHAFDGPSALDEPFMQKVLRHMVHLNFTVLILNDIPRFDVFISKK